VSEFHGALIYTERSAQATPELPGAPKGHTARMQRLGIIGLGSVFAGPYRNLIRRLAQDDLVEVTAVFDIDDGKHEAGARLFGAARAKSAEAVIARDDVDTVLILTAMNAHGPLARATLEAGKHVLVEKPMATSLEEAAELVELSRSAPGLLVCAPHIVLSPTYREIHRRVGEGAIGNVVLARARYGWAGPWWGRWFYEEGGDRSSTWASTTSRACAGSWARCAGSRRSSARRYRSASSRAS
jgi:predicted dehydrogenase